MLTSISPRPGKLHISRGNGFLLTDVDGFVTGAQDQGLYVRETRVLSRLRYLIDGEPPECVVASPIEQQSALLYYIAPAPNPDGETPRQASRETLELRVRRGLGRGFTEALRFTNYTHRRTRFRFEIELDADFDDFLRARMGERKQRGQRERRWEDGTLLFDYRASHYFEHEDETGEAYIHRQSRITLTNSDTPVQQVDGKLRFDIELGPHACWHAGFEVLVFMEQRHDRPDSGVRLAEIAPEGADVLDANFREAATVFETPESRTLASTVMRTVKRAGEDIIALRRFDIETPDNTWTVSAGIPGFSVLFARDALTVSWQAAMLGPEFLQGSLEVVQRLQGTRIDDWRDEQPGRIFHEAHGSPSAVLNFNPMRLYFGDMTASAFYPLVLTQLWHWTGDKALVRRYLDPALKALRWLDEYGDFDDDGFYEYQTRSPKGVKNQAWKDSSDAVVYEDGTVVKDPISMCETQSLAYFAKLMLAETVWWLDERSLSAKLFKQAHELKQRFNEHFWQEDLGYFAMGLDPNKQPIRSIGSDPGHCLATGIIDDSRVERTAERMFRPDLFSGWGVRTLSSEHPAFNPYSYHRGAVWPVENGIFALALRRYGLVDKLHRLARAQFEAADLFTCNRLPEVYSGHSRSREQPFPALYPQANWPQA